MVKLSISVPEEFVDSTGGEDAAKQRMTRLSVLDLLRRQEISTGKAAHMLGMNRWDFADLAAEHNIPSFDLLPGETMEEHLRISDENFERMRSE